MFADLGPKGGKWQKKKHWYSRSLWKLASGAWQGKEKHPLLHWDTESSMPAGMWGWQVSCLQRVEEVMKGCLRASHPASWWLRSICLQRQWVVKGPTSCTWLALGILCFLTVAPTREREAPQTCSAWPSRAGTLAAKETMSHPCPFAPGAHACPPPLAPT